MKIEAVKTRWVLDSIGYPTVEVDVVLKGGAYGRASVPSGVNNGSFEAIELRDQSTLFGGKGVSKALNLVEHTIAPVITGMDANNQEEIDAKLVALDGTKDKSRLGSNTCLAVSIAAAKAAASANKLPFYLYISQLAGIKSKLFMPMPMFNVINGGVHAENSLDIQEILIIPVKARNIQTAIRMGMEIFNQLGIDVNSRNYAKVYGLQGGYALIKIASNQKALDLLMQSIEKAGYKPGEDVTIGIDMAADSLYKQGQYILESENNRFGPKAYSQWLEEMIKKYPITLVEDPFFEEGWDSWTTFSAKHGKHMQIVGDNLLSTNAKRLQKAVAALAANAILIKPSHIGTLTETINTQQFAVRAGWQTIIASRAGESEDSFLAHLAVGLNIRQIKFGSVSRGERTAKYNELLRISESINSGAIAKLYI